MRTLAKLFECQDILGDEPYNTLNTEDASAFSCGDFNSVPRLILEEDVLTSFISLQAQEGSMAGVPQGGSIWVAMQGNVFAEASVV